MLDWRNSTVQVQRERERESVCVCVCVRQSFSLIYISTENDGTNLLMSRKISWVVHGLPIIGWLNVPSCIILPTFVSGLTRVVIAGIKIIFHLAQSLSYIILYYYFTEHIITQWTHLRISENVLNNKHNEHILENVLNAFCIVQFPHLPLSEGRVRDC